MNGLALRVALALGVLCTSFCAGSAFAERRVALVLGNSAYQNAPELPNPASDAKAMAAMFQKAGFEVVSAQYDVGIVQFRRVIRQFMDVASSADIAVVYYAGHGIEIHGSNYLVPIDAKLESDRDADDEAIRLERLIESVEGAKRLRLIILDACRDNPFTRSMKLQRTATLVRGVNPGLGEVEPSVRNTLIAYAAKAGSEAEDGAGKHSPFTTALLNDLFVPGLDIRLAFGRVRDAVLKNTRERQEPFVYGSLGGGNISLVPSPDQQPSTLGPKLADASSGEKADYSLVEKIGTPGAWQVFVNQYPKGFYSDLARQQIAKLSGEQPPPAGASKPSGERPYHLANVEPTKPPTTNGPVSEEQQVWAKIKDSSDLAAFRAFIKQYPTSVLAREAQLHVQMIEEEQKAKEREAALQRAEEERQAQLAEVKRQADEARRKIAEQDAALKHAQEEAKAAEEARQKAEAEAARKRQEQEAQQKAAAAATAKQQTDAEAARKKAQQDLAQQKAALKAELKRLKDEAKAAEEARQKAEAKAAQKRMEEAEQKKAAVAAAAKQQADAEADRKKAEQDAALQRAQAEAKAAEEVRQKAEREAALKRQEARQQEKAGAAAIAKQQADAAAARRKAEQDAAQQKAEQQAALENAQAEAKVAEEARKNAEAEAARKRAEETRQAALAEAARVKQEAVCNQEQGRLSSLQAAGRKARDDLKQLEQGLTCERLLPLVVAALARANAMPDENTPDQVRLAQKQLTRLGCYSGAANGTLNDDTRAAVKRYHDARDKSADKIVITDEFVAELSKQTTRVCPLVCGAGERANGERCVVVEKSAPAARESRENKAQRRKAERENAPHRKEARERERKQSNPRPHVVEEASRGHGGGGGGGTTIGVGF